MLQTDTDFGGVSSSSTLRGNARAFTCPYNDPSQNMIRHNADPRLSPGDHDHDEEK
jgi:hypothetical protein